MEIVLRSAAVYLFLTLVFRIAGKRALAEMTPFDVLLLLIISESVSQALTGDDFSLTNAMVLVITLVLMELAFAFVKQKSKVAERLLDDVPLIVVVDGKPLKDRMDQARVNEEDVLEAARGSHGLERLEQVKYAVLERGGSISVIPKSGKG